jgi:short-subunit dehydrogenase
MELDGARVLVAGATGALGGRLALGLRDRGARVALAGRDAGALATLAADHPGAPRIPFDLRDPATIGAAVDGAASALGGLDGLVVATGAPAFGAVDELDDAVAADLMTVNALGPIALVRAALGHLGEGGGIAALSAIVADHPTAGMAAYSASKAALSAYLEAARRELRRRKIDVLDVRPPHLETTFASRALAGSPPSLPAGMDPGAVVTATLDALAAGRRTITYDLRERALVTA